MLLATFPPQFVGTPPHRGAGAPFVPELNQRIARRRAERGRDARRSLRAISADVKRYIGVDGLHPTEQGFALMAQTFAKVIQDTFEVKPTAR